MKKSFFIKIIALKYKIKIFIIGFNIILIINYIIIT